MQKRTLGRTGLQVTQLGFGAMEIRGPRIWRGRPVTDEQANRILNAVLDSGINFIDSSHDYGLSEEYIGKYISGRRQEYYLATKCGCFLEDAGDHDNTLHVWTRENLMRNLETSLRRMKTEYIDVWQLHNATVADVEQGDIVRVMQDAKASGKVRWIGASAVLPHLSTFAGWGVFDTFQIPYSALQRAEENNITAAAQAGAGTIIRGGVARGAPDDAGLGAQDRWATWEKAKLDELRGPGESRTAFMLRMTLSHPHMHTTIVGTLFPEHLAENRKFADLGPLPADVYREALRRLDGAGEQPAA
ncbi:MAG: aldo/keto reductase [Chloroflexi bacterium]|nr:aldo/keto reductase [Chloroflexota bacterium]